MAWRGVTSVLVARLCPTPEFSSPIVLSAELMGTVCEPWLARPAVTLLHELLLPGNARALEWGSGSSSAWLLAGRVRSLLSIEHDSSKVRGPPVAGLLEHDVRTAF